MCLLRYTTIDVAGVGATTRKGAPVNIAISLPGPEMGLLRSKNVITGTDGLGREKVLTTSRGSATSKPMALIQSAGLGSYTQVLSFEDTCKPRALGDELKRKLNCTVYIEDMPGKNAWP